MCRSGHNWGSPHDPSGEECAPGGGQGGKFIMYWVAVSGQDRHNEVRSEVHTVIIDPQHKVSLYSLHSVNLILVLVHLILRISPHHSHHLCSHHLSLPRPFTLDLKLISFTNPFLRSHSAFMDLEPVLN